jgi:uncharacterized membrane protein (UPF0182 family)
VRVPDETPAPTRRGVRRSRVWILVGLVLVVVVLASLKTIATVYTDFLWFEAVGLGGVWRRLAAVKLGLFGTFAAGFFLILFGNLALVDRSAPSLLELPAGDHLVRRYRRLVGTRAVGYRAVVSLVAALIAGAPAVSHWETWLLFRDQVRFDASDPLFHQNVGFFVFTYPFLEFLVHWLFGTFVVVVLFVGVAHVLNGSIRVEGGRLVVSGSAKAHVSYLLALLALVKAAGYLLARYGLELSSNGYVQGAGYADVHARLPAISLLFWVSLVAAVALLVNIRLRGLALPAVAVGSWVVVGVLAGAVYPALVQALKVGPAQDVLERPYIADNITATRRAYGLEHVQVHRFADSQTIDPSALASASSELADVRLWDPELTAQTFAKLQALRSYYTFAGTLAMDRYPIDGSVVPAVVGVREVDAADLPAKGWVNTHLQYTHGYGMIVAPANAVDGQGDPSFALSDLPPVSTDGLPPLRQPSVYYAPGESGYVVVHTRQPEVDYQLQNGANVESSYHGSGGVALSSFVRRVAFAIRFSDLNLLISDLITSRSRIMFVRDIQARVAKAAPFLALDADPYPVMAEGRIFWIQDAYTTSDDYPYSENADTSMLPPSSGLAGQTFNYVRNSVKVVVDAYTGKMTFYVADPRDPIVRAWERAFPGMFTPMSKMPAGLRAHLRYPEDLFAVQAAMYGRYHITNPEAFYNAGDAWNLSQSPGAGPPQAALAQTFTTNAEGQLVPTGQVQRMAPIYEMLELPGEDAPSFDLLEAFVPVSTNDQIQTLAAFMVANCGPTDYGQLAVYVTPRGESLDGPALIDAKIQATPSISEEITLLNSNGSSVILGNVVMVPVGQSMLYVRPLYVQSSRNAFPQLERVIVVWGEKAAIGDTFADALAQVLAAAGVAVPQATGAPGTTLSPAVRSLVAQEGQLYSQVQADLKAGNLGAYQQDVERLGAVIAQLQALVGEAPAGTGGASGEAGSNGGTEAGSGAGASGGKGTSNGAEANSGTSTSSGATSQAGASSSGGAASTSTSTSTGSPSSPSVASPGGGAGGETPPSTTTTTVPGET